MKIIFSPSKGMESKKIKNTELKKEFYISDKTKELLETLKNLNKIEIGNIMKIKGELLEKTYFNFQNYNSLACQPSIGLYSGVSFKSLNIEKYKDSNFNYMEEHLRILSAFYGVLTPFAEIKEYRLDMTMKILSESLYSFWKNEVSKSFEPNEIIVNLASAEFSKMIDRKKYKVIEIGFGQLQNGKIKSISTEVKKMRGKMLEFMIVNEVEDIELLKNFTVDNYVYSLEFSKEDSLNFIKNN
ncbi:YaaA family protein [Cetobacterium sp. 2A]|uniref:YaaA family protein n=1 Tax=Cetobacterium sp. 2A TaxID=2754723 RepID=UPI00163BB28B|nr:YaaA family protein [Cetobacterium sp. 2A]MBC2855441.1 YaaA family protein [Cetobacterium sp. 2A]